MEVCGVYTHTSPFFTVPASHPQLGHIENDSFKVLFNSPLGLNLFSALHPCLPHFLSDCGCLPFKTASLGWPLSYQWSSLLWEACQLTTCTNLSTALQPQDHLGTLCQAPGKADLEGTHTQSTFICKVTGQNGRFPVCSRILPTTCSLYSTSFIICNFSCLNKASALIRYRKRIKVVEWNYVDNNILGQKVKDLKNLEKKTSRNHFSFFSRDSDFFFSMILSIFLPGPRFKIPPS